MNLVLKGGPVELEGLQLPPGDASAAAEESAPWAALEEEAKGLEAAGRWAEAAGAWRRLYTLAWRRHYEQLRSLQLIAQQEAPPPERPMLSLQEEKVRLAALGVRPVGRLPHGGRGIIALAFSPQGEFLASACQGGELWLWSVVREERLRSWAGHSADVWDVAFSPDGGLLATASDDGTVALWEVPGMREVRRMKGEGPFNAVLFSPDGQTLLTGNDQGEIHFWECATGRPSAALAQIKAHHGPILGLARTSDGTLLASASEDGTAALWDRQGQCLRRFQPAAGPLNDIAFVPGGGVLAAGADDGRIFLWGMESGQPHLILEGHTEAVNAVAFSPDGTLLASASADQTVRLWSPRLGWEVHALERHSDWATSVAFSPDGTLVASCSYDGAIWLWLLLEGGA